MYQIGTLTEIMIATFLSLLVMSASVKSYLNLHQILLKQQALQAEQQKAWSVISLINAEIEKAGHRGCYAQDNAAIKITKNSLMVSYQDYPSVNMTVNSTGRRIIVDKLLHLKKGQTLMISDCQHAEIFMIEELRVKNGKQVIIPAHALQYSYHDYAEISSYIVRRYFMALPLQLARIDADGYQQAIANGIYDLQFQQDARGIYYQFATEYHGKFTAWHGYAAKNTA